LYEAKIEELQENGHTKNSGTLSTTHYLKHSGLMRWLLLRLSMVKPDKFYKFWDIAANNTEFKH